MSDIFLSYKSEDRTRAKIIAKALELHGYSVWWDRIIPPGKTFDQVIEEELDVANCVIVLWSKRSGKSDWVKNEAREGTRRGILIPVLIDDVKIPFEFKHIQAANLIDWQGTLPNPEFDLLLKSVGELSGKPLITKIEVKKPSIDELNIAAQELYDEGKYYEAIDKWKEVLNLVPENGIAIEGIKNSRLRKAEEESRKMEGKGREKSIRKEQEVAEKRDGEKKFPSEIDPTWKWGSMIASLVGILILSILTSPFENFYESEIIIYLFLSVLIFGLPATIYLMYKERKERIEYGFAWIFIPILMMLFGFFNRDGPDVAILGFLFFGIPAIIIDFIYVYKTR